MAQARGAGAPPSEPPMAPPDAMGAPEGGMPDPVAMLPQIAMALGELAQALPPDKQQVVLECAQRLQAVSEAEPANSGGMPSDDAAAYGESA